MVVMKWGVLNLKYVDQVDCGLCGAYVVVGAAGVDATAASGTLKCAKLRVNPTHTQLGLYVEVTAQNPLVAVGHAESAIPSLVAVVLEVFEIGSEEVEASHVDVSHIVLSAKCVGCYKVSCHSVTEPVASLGLHHPVLPLLAMIESPCVEITRKVDRPSGGNFGLGTEIDCEECVIDEIGLECYLLSLHGVCRSQ